MFGTYLILLLLSITIGITLAFFASSDFASKLLGTSGRVKIEAVGDGDKSIEDIIPNSCNLEIRLDRDYGVLIPNMPITIYANCKVYKSTTKPLLRANLAVTIIDSTGNPVDADEGDDNITNDIRNQILDRIDENDNWYMHSDGYYYLVDSKSGANSILTECDATAGNIIVPFLNGKSITVPNYIDDSYSGLGIKIKIIFQAIQNFIPDDNGIKMSNTITNSLKIFNEFKTTLYESSPISWFNTSVSSSGIVSVSAKENVTYPEYLRLPEKDASGRTITNISSNLVNGNASIKNVYIPSTYTTMDKEAFAYSSLLTVDMRDSQITEIPKNAFINSQLVSIKLPNTITAIRTYAFYNTPLTSLEIPEGCVTCESYAVTEVEKLTYLSIPSTLTNINIATFGTMGNLRTMVVASGNPFLSLVDNAMLVSTSGNLYACVKYGTQVETIQIPDNITTIQQYAFYVVGGNNSFKNIILGKNLSSIDFVCPHCLQTLSLGSNTNFSELNDEYGNNYITNLAKDTVYIANIASTATKLTIMDSVKNFAPSILPETNKYNITHINIGKGFNNYTDSFFRKFSNMSSLSIDSNNTTYKTLTGCELLSLDGKVFYQYLSGARNTEYTVPSTVTEIVINALRDNRYLAKLNIPDSVTIMGDCLAMNYTNLQEINLPSNTYNVSYLLYGCSKITNVVYNGTVRSSGLVECSALKTIKISNCPKVGINFCDSCTSLEWVEFTDTTPPTFASQIMFQNAKSSFVIYVPDSAVNAYKTANNLSIFASRIKPVSERP